jgi:hypothetical protein
MDKKLLDSLTQDALSYAYGNKADEIKTRLADAALDIIKDLNKAELRFTQCDQALEYVATELAERQNCYYCPVGHCGKEFERDKRECTLLIKVALQNAGMEKKRLSFVIGDKPRTDLMMT